MTNYKKAKELVSRHHVVDVSLFQRTLKIPYRESLSILDKLLSRGIVEQAEGKYYKQKI